MANATLTKPMGVSHVGFLLRRLAEDCHPLQQYREITENAIQAIMRTAERPGYIIWDVDWDYYEKSGGIYKLCCTDTGDGMTGPEIMEYINKLSSSIEKQSLESNYGIGAKIAACTVNPAGILYKSWKHGEGVMAHLWLDDETGDYGLQQIERGDDTFDYWAPIEDVAKPKEIQEHGTKVTLLGESEEQDTFDTPLFLRKRATAPKNGRWLRRYLNTRYYRIPDGITIKVRDSYTHPREDTRHNVLISVYGMEYYLTKHNRAQGVVRLSDARVHWWVWKDTPEAGETRPFFDHNQDVCASKGHVAALYQDELYEMQEGSSGIARLQQFGILNAQQHFVLYVEPLPAPGITLTTNTARTHLLLDQQDLPWERWSAEFRRAMPPELREIVESYQNPHDRNIDMTIQQRLRKMPNLFRMKRYVPKPDGPWRPVQSPPAERAEKTYVPPDPEVMVDIFQNRNRVRQKKRNPLSLFKDEIKVERAKNGGLQEVVGQVLPAVHWVSVKDGTRAEGYLEDKAATYTTDSTGGPGDIYANRDFRGFQVVIDKFANEYRHVPGSAQIVESTVLEWFQQTLIETVLGIQALKGGRIWTEEALKDALEGDGLTTAVMPRYLMLLQIKRVLGGRLMGAGTPPDEDNEDVVEMMASMAE